MVVPTETVYGLAANGLSESAVAGIFAAKGRPAHHPLILHVAHLEDLPKVVAEWPEEARRLAEAFWPGPLTLILPRTPAVPDAVTAGGDTVGVRIPAHPVALRLIDAVGGPLAMPSANPFTRLSPTRAEDVELPGIDVLDGGPCAVGIESTVVDLAHGAPRVLRPGGVPREAIEAALRTDVPLAEAVGLAPGQHARHYSPRTPVRFVDRLHDEPGLGFGRIAGPGQRSLPLDPRAAAISLYAALHDLDAAGHPEIAIERPPDGPAWEAVRDRLRRATT